MDQGLGRGVDRDHALGVEVDLELVSLRLPGGRLGAVEVDLERIVTELLRHPRGEVAVRGVRGLQTLAHAIALAIDGPRPHQRHGLTFEFLHLGFGRKLRRGRHLRRHRGLGRPPTHGEQFRTVAVGKAARGDKADSQGEQDHALNLCLGPGWGRRRRDGRSGFDRRSLGRLDRRGGGVLFGDGFGGALHGLGGRRGRAQEEGRRGGGGFRSHFRGRALRETRAVAHWRRWHFRGGRLGRRQMHPRRSRSPLFLYMLDLRHKLGRGPALQLQG